MSQVKYQLISKQGDFEIEDTDGEELRDFRLEITVVREPSAVSSFFSVTLGILLGFFIYVAAVSIDLKQIKHDWSLVDQEAIESILNKTIEERSNDPFFEKVRIVCIVMSDSFENSNTEEVQKTWGKHCNKLLFPNSEELSMNDAKGGNKMLSQIKNVYTSAFNNNLDDGEWFLKTKNDTYVIMQNLREMLQSYNYKEPLVFGQKYLEAGYLAQGAIVLSKESLRRLVQESFPNEHKCGDGKKGSGNGDIELHRCLESVDIKQIDTRDQKLSERFFEVDVEVSLFPAHERNDDRWYWYKLNQGIDTCCSDKPISFHGLKQSKLYLYEYLIKMVRTFGTKAELTIVA